MNLVFLIPVLILWCSICEWLLHRFIMHNTLFGIKYPYETHAKVHHVVFKADETYQLQKVEDKKTIPMAWWNGVVIATLSSLPLLYFGLKFFLLNFVIAYCYYLVYETLHWYMHLPKRRFVEYRNWYKKLNGHHILHHRYTNKNFNVVLPFADWLFGTLLKKSPIKFAQVKESYCVPNLQPVEVIKKNSISFAWILWLFKKLSYHPKKIITALVTALLVWLASFLHLPNLPFLSFLPLPAKQEQKQEQKPEQKKEIVTQTNYVTSTNTVSLTNNVTATNYVTQTNFVTETKYVTNFVMQPIVVTNTIIKEVPVTVTNVLVIKNNTGNNTNNRNSVINGPAFFLSEDFNTFMQNQQLNQNR